MDAGEEEREQGVGVLLQDDNGLTTVSHKMRLFMVFQFATGQYTVNELCICLREDEHTVSEI